MGASKSKRSRSVNIDRNRYGLSRPREIRRSLPVLVVVCDDAKTAVSYFNELKQKVKKKLTLRVVRNPSDRATPQDVINWAQVQKQKLVEESSHDDTDRSEVWALIDLEQESARRAAGFAAKEAGETAGISVALSDPCYEVWTLLHLADTGESFDNCNSVLSRIEVEWHKKLGQEFGKKAQADYSKILPARTDAAVRARKHHEVPDPSWTEIYLVSEMIDLLSE